MVNATEGSTVLGSFDPLRPIHSVCRRFGLWLHADSAWGGAVLLSGRLRHKMTGVELWVTSTSVPAVWLPVGLLSALTGGRGCGLSGWSADVF